MKLDRWKIFWGVALLLLSTVFYLFHYLTFRDPHHLFIFLVGDIAFVFIEVLIVTMIIHELLDYRDRKAKLHRLNMVIGAFFSEIGTELLRRFSRFDKNSGQITEGPGGFKDWLNARGQCETYQPAVDLQQSDLKALQDFFMTKRPFMLVLIQNSNLLEHDSFSNLLWAVFHLGEELLYREDVAHMTNADRRHLEIDMQRAYTALIVHWVSHMRHLKGAYPHLFSLAARMNPFDPDASPVVKE